MDATLSIRPMLSGKEDSVSTEEITDLLLSISLNLWRNSLTGVITCKIGQLKPLESVDLSRNQLSGAIPISITDLNFLSLLDFSYNNLSGKIPSSTQLQSSDASAFACNLALWGRLLTPTCPRKDSPETDNDSQDNEENVDQFKKWFYIGFGTRFGAFFWGVLGALLLKASWRHYFFYFLGE